jgi:hypothetical protein
MHFKPLECLQGGQETGYSFAIDQVHLEKLAAALALNSQIE